MVRALDSLDDASDLSNGMKPGQSEVFNSADHSAQIRMFQRMAFGSQDYSTNYFNQSQSSWRSREHGDQTQSREQRDQSREHGDQTRSTWSRDERDQDAVTPIDRSGVWNI